MFTEKELESEKWKEIDGYDGMYQVSDLGRVRSLKFGKVRVLRVLSFMRERRLVYSLAIQDYVGGGDELA